MTVTVDPARLATRRASLGDLVARSEADIGLTAMPQAHFGVPAAMSTTLSPSCELRHAPAGWEKARLLESMTF